MNTRMYLSILFLFFSFSLVSAAKADFSIEDYGALPQSRSVTISPDAKYFAYLTSVEGEDAFVVSEIATGKAVSGARLNKLKARDAYFIDQNHIVFSASETTQVFGYRGRFENSGSFVMNLETRKVTLLLNKSDSLFPAQGGLGAIVGVNAKDNVVYMPAYSKSSASPSYDLYRVGLKRGHGKIYKQGNPNTIDWFMGANGRVLAREDYSGKTQEHKIYSFLSGKRKLIYEKKSSVPSIAIEAVAADESSLLFREGSKVYQMSLNDGAITDADIRAQVDGSEVSYLKTDLNRKLIAVSYSGLMPFQVMENSLMDQHYSALVDSMPSTFVSLASFTPDRKNIVVSLSGNETSGAYLLYNTDSGATKMLGRQYPKVSKQHIGEIVPMKYAARDETSIPAILTWPTGVAKGSSAKLPLIVLPHGGPAVYDHIEFDWWSQYLARKGYLVLQPNFRGSSGFGHAHESAGNGEWGKSMQDDVSDGVLKLIEAGYADPERVCIMGASYGGYSALAGGAFSPELYKCVVSVAGVSDLPKMLYDTKQNFGADHWVNRYWKEVIGDSKKEREKLNEISPAKFADKFQAPVLLIHGKDDTVVPFRQSKIMHTALRKAKKDSKLVRLKGEDHWLSNSETRIEMLNAIDAFLDKHNPVVKPN